jgi:formaldehyde-activating enzyme
VNYDIRRIFINKMQKERAKAGAEWVPRSYSGSSVGPRGSAAEKAFANSLTNNKDGFTSLLAVIAPNRMVKPATVMFNKATIKDAKQAVQMFGPAQHAVAKAVADSLAEGVIPRDQADDLFICVGVFIHWDAADNKKIQDYNYRATKEATPWRNGRTGSLSESATAF